MVLSIQSRSEKIWIHHYPFSILRLAYWLLGKQSSFFKLKLDLFVFIRASLEFYCINRVLWIKTMLKRKFITRFLLLHRITLLYKNLKDIDISMWSWHCSLTHNIYYDVLFTVFFFNHLFLVFIRPNCVILLGNDEIERWEIKVKNTM